ncbi:MAG: anaerobic glycerol-3-phosphate dehydrogenase subunit C [Desulfosarcinaceae bacterium]
MPDQQTNTIPWNTLRASLDGELHTDWLRCYLLSTDGSIFRRQPRAVAYPRSAADVAAAVRFAAGNGLSLHARGSGSGLCGSSVGPGLVLDFSKYMNRLIRLDLEEGWFECEPGYRLGELEAELEGSGLFFPPDPSSGEYASFGGMCATNASGAHSVKYGNVADYLTDARVVFADGGARWLSGIGKAPLADLPPNLQDLARLYEDYAEAIARAYPPIACNVAGYNLRGLVADGRLRLHRLLCGAEGTLGVATRLKFRLHPRPAADSLVVAFFDDIVKAAKAAQLAMTLQPSGIEIMDKSLLSLARSNDPDLAGRIPGGIDNVLLMEWDGPSAEACEAPAQDIQARLKAAGLTDQAYLAVSALEKAKFWALRKAAVPILYKLKGRRKILALVEDAAVPLAGLVPYFEGIYAIFARFGVDFVLYGHIAKGLMHTRPLLDLKDPGDVALLRPIADAVYDLVDGLGGTVSGEHGDGRLRSAYIQRKYPELYGLFRQTKALLDPNHMFNPEIKQTHDPDQMTHHLRFGGAYHAHDLAGLQLGWTPGFVEEVERCHGCSKCTTVTTATRMCPVYKAIRDEAASPKAKANALRALISGAADTALLYQKSLRQVMAHCVNCGSCAMECPSNVNIPKLAMEAKALYARRFGSRLADRLTAEVETTARLTHSLAPLVDPVLDRPPLQQLACRLTGLAPRRSLVRFARRSLFQRTPQRSGSGNDQVIYYAGCYAGFIRPELGQAAVRVLKALGMRVHLPPQACCGLPQLSKGMAAAARRKARLNLDRWGKLLARAAHVVVTCSSCGFALMKDWSYLLPHQEAEKVRRKTIHISVLVNRHADRLQLRASSLHLAYHQPCHLRIQPEPGSTLDLLGGLPGVTLTNLESRCCGIAGSWGLLAENYALSKSIGDPLVRDLENSGAACAATDCPTCQMQLEHLGRLPVRHPVEILADCLKRPE